MRKVNYEDSFSEVVDFLKNEIADMLDVNSKHIEVLSVEVEGSDEFYENGDIATVRKVEWRTRDWKEGEPVYGEKRASAWVSIDYGEDGITDHDDVVFYDYDKCMEEE